MRSKFVILTATALSFGFAQAASAADMPTKMPMKAPPMVAAPYNWTGFYGGVYVGGAFGSRDATATDPVSTAAPFIGPYDLANPLSYNVDSSFIAGGTLGYNFQTGNWVFGPELEFGYMRLTGSGTFTGGISNGELSATSVSGDWYGVLAARVGYAWDNVLVYAKGGAALVRQKASVVDTTVSAINPGLLDAESDRTKVGFAVGGGVEWAFAPKWSVKAEYLYLGVNSSDSACGVDTGAASLGFGATFCSPVTFPAIHTGKVGINYHF